MNEDPIAQVFATPPDQLQPGQIDRIIAHYREARKNFDMGDKKAGKTVRGPKKDQIDIDLSSFLNEETKS